MNINEAQTKYDNELPSEELYCERCEEDCEELHKFFDQDVCDHCLEVLMKLERRMDYDND